MRLHGTSPWHQLNLSHYAFPHCAAKPQTTPLADVPEIYLGGSVLRKSIPDACWPTSTVATVFIAFKSITSTVPGSEPIPSTETNAYSSSGEMTTPCSTFRLVANLASSLPDFTSKIDTD